jgi:hypothetical protein
LITVKARSSINHQEYTIIAILGNYENFNYHEQRPIPSCIKNF